ncbi:hypothetical protein CYK37_29595 [Mesorhizobium loti]|nr:ClbS/DfsB family four-helix bundle protein [Mesorhizobium loti]PLP55595.1 hypothetical protein CYK37_29595 [Mesorhizobium loti]
MQVPQNKEELLKAIEHNYSNLIHELREIPGSLVDQRSLDGHVTGTRMSVIDLVAYLVGWNELVLKWLAKDAAGQPIDFPDAGYKWNELGKLAQKFYRDYDSVPYTQLLERLDSAKRQIIGFVETRTNQQLYGSVWYEKWTMGRMIQFNTSSPYKNAHRRLRKWRKAPAICATPKFPDETTLLGQAGSASLPSDPASQ